LGWQGRDHDCRPEGAETVDPSRLFPSDDETQFGDWVKAGALKIGDEVSTRESIESFGPRIAANDNEPLTVTDIVRDSRAARVYNFEVESLSGEITHNYFVGDEQAWVHNAEHKKGKRPSTAGKHDEGTARKGRDGFGGEKGDDRRKDYKNPKKGCKIPKPGDPKFIGPLLKLFGR
jgi:hypothetical protein